MRPLPHHRWHAADLYNPQPITHPYVHGWLYCWSELLGLTKPLPVIDVMLDGMLQEMFSTSEVRQALKELRGEVDTYVKKASGTVDDMLMHHAT
jgi:hypothetical protein